MTQETALFIAELVIRIQNLSHENRINVRNELEKVGQMHLLHEKIGYTKAIHDILDVLSANIKGDENVTQDS